jgi:hypothetical protein
MTEQEPDRPADAPWITIHDEVVTSEELVIEVERRVAQRRAQLGRVNLVFPTFGHISTFPEPTEEDNLAGPQLYYYLKQANQTELPAVDLALAPSPATRMPVIGRLWGTIRREMHNLVLFYVNRSVRDQNQLNVNLISTLNELTRVVQKQRAELESLRDELRRFKE